MPSGTRSWTRRRSSGPFIIRHPSSAILYLSLLISFLLFFPSSISSQEGKIGYVDSMRLRTEFREFGDAQAKFDEDVKAWEDEATQMRGTIDSLKKDLDETALILSEAKRKEKED